MLGGVFIFLRDVVRTFCIFSFLSCLDTLFLCIVITNLVFLLIYIFDEVVITFLSPIFMCCFFSLFMHMLLISCMQSFISVSH